MDWKSWLLELHVSNWSKPIPFERAFEVVTVFAGSPADFIGLTAGMYLLAQKVDDTDPWLLDEMTPDLVSRTVFVDPGPRKRLDIVARTFPFGVRLQRPLEAIELDAGRERHFDEYLFDRVHEGDDDVLDRMSAALRTPLRSGIGGWVKQLRHGKSDPIDDRDDSLRLIVATQEARRGNIDSARGLLEGFEEANNRNTTILAVYYYCLSLIAEAEGAPKEAIDGFVAVAAEYRPLSKRIAQRYNERFRQPPRLVPETYPAPFPLDYLLRGGDPLLDPAPSPEVISFRDTLGSLAADQFLIVVLLGPYRVNGYYARMLRKLAILYAVVGRHFPMIHVITEFKKGDSYYAGYMFGEEIAGKIGIPLKIMTDQDGSLGEALGMTGSPHVVIVNKSGQMVYGHRLDDDEGYWAALATLPDAEPAGTRA